MYDIFCLPSLQLHDIYYIYYMYISSQHDMWRLPCLGL